MQIIARARLTPKKLYCVIEVLTPICSILKNCLYAKFILVLLSVEGLFEHLQTTE